MSDTDLTAFLTAALITLIFVPFIITKVPRCEHEACNEAHRAEVAKERKANQAEGQRQLHGWHSWDRPQKGCALCSEFIPCPACGARGGCRPECECAKCV